MHMASTTSPTIDAYIEGFPASVQTKLDTLRRTIREELPEAEEGISYKIPAFRVDGRYVLYMAGYAQHVAVYPAPVGHPDFEADMARYGSGKGTARFPLDEDLPLDLIRRIARFQAERRRASP